jgi:arylsulfatase A-like enzyme
LVFYGAGVPAKEVFRKVAVKDLAPTLAHLLGTALPNACTGTPLEEVVKKRSLDGLPPLPSAGKKSGKKTRN